MARAAGEIRNYDSVKITDGPFKGYSGTIEQVFSTEDGKQSTLVRLIVQVDAEQVEVTIKEEDRYK